MAKERIQKQIRKERQNNYLSRDFDQFRAQLLEYARAYFPDKIKDFGEASLGGMFLDMNAFVGDNLSYYLDHQFRELNPRLAVETANIESHLRNAGVKIVGASPAVVNVTVFLEVYAIGDASNGRSGNPVPDPAMLPRLSQGTTLRSSNGVVFTLAEDVDFTETDADGNLKCFAGIDAGGRIGQTGRNGNFGTVIVNRDVLCVSGEQKTETFAISNTSVPFRTVTLANPNVSQIISVTDSDGNVYHEVDSLTQSEVFRSTRNTNEDRDIVESSLELIPAPYRFIAGTSLSTRTTTLTFGSGDAETLDDDIVPDPSEAALPLFGKTTFSRFSIDPNKLLETQSLGISPRNTTLTVVYRHGGGRDHNVAAGSIRFVKTLLRDFPKSYEFNAALHPGRSSSSFTILSGQVINSIDVTNNDQSVGGDAAPSVSDLRSRIAATRFAQERIVTKQDLLARIYTIPSKFGRVYRASASPNPENPLSTLIHIISRDSKGRLTTSTDTLKRNLRIYLNEYRLISDAYDVLDAEVINFQVRYRILIDPNYNKSGVIAQANTAIAKSLRLQNFQINQPIVRDDIVNILINTQGIISLTNLEFVPIPVNTQSTVLTTTFEGRAYSALDYNFAANFLNGVYLPPNGGIFELRYPSFDIKGAAV